MTPYELPAVTVCVRDGSLEAIDFLRRFAEERSLRFALQDGALAAVRQEVFDRGAAWETWGAAIADAEEREERPWPDLELESKIRDALPPGGIAWMVPPPTEDSVMNDAHDSPELANYVNFCRSRRRMGILPAPSRFVRFLHKCCLFLERMIERHGFDRDPKRGLVNARERMETER